MLLQKQKKARELYLLLEWDVSSLRVCAARLMEFDIPSSLAREPITASSLLRGGHGGPFTLASVRNLAFREKLSGRAEPCPEASPSFEPRPSRAPCPLLQGGGPLWVLEASHGPPFPLHLPGQDP